MKALHAVLDQHTLPFIQALTGCDEEAAFFEAVTIQTIDDEKPGGAPNPAQSRIIHGCIDDLAYELDRLNEEGAGIFMAVNQADGKGRKKANIRALSGWHADLDLKDASSPFSPDSLPLTPTMIVKTPGGWHLYWLAPAPMPCEGEVRRKEHEAELKGICQALRPYGADPKVCFVNAVLRLPGFLHRKREPRLVELVTAAGPRYAREQILGAFPPMESKPRPRAAVPAPSFGPVDRAAVLRRAEAYLATMPGGVQGCNGSGATLKAALKVISRFDLSEVEGLNVMMRIHNPKCQPEWSDWELRHKVSDAWNMAQESSNRGSAFRENRGQLTGGPLQNGVDGEFAHA